MKKILIIIFAFVCFVIGIAAVGYVLVRHATSDKAIKGRLVSMMKDFGETEIGHAHLDLSEGVIIDNLSFVGTSEEVKGKSLKIPKIVLRYDPLSLLKGRLNISNAIIIAPELTVEKPTDIWSLLDTIKANFDNLKMPTYTQA